jgi:hypothetical protein
LQLVEGKRRATLSTPTAEQAAEDRAARRDEARAAEVPAVDRPEPGPGTPGQAERAERLELRATPDREVSAARVREVLAARAVRGAMPARVVRPVGLDRMAA